LKFKRQVPIDRYFADFVCEEKKLIIELDDRSHDDRLDKVYQNLNGVFEFLVQELE